MFSAMETSDGIVTGTVHAGGHEVVVLQSGSGPETLLWFPAVADSAASFSATMITLARQLAGRLKIVSVNPPGYGMSPGPLITFTAMFEWVVEFAQQFPGPIYAAGNSAGGALATAVAAEFVGQVKKLLLVCWPDPHCDMPDSQHLCPDTPQKMHDLLDKSWHRPPKLDRKILASVCVDLCDEVFQQHVHSLQPDQVKKHYAAFTGEVVFIGGDSDQLVPPALMRESAQKRGTDAIILEACGHYPHRERARHFCQVLTQLINNNPIQK